MIIKDDDLRRIVKLAYVSAFLVGDQSVDPTDNPNQYLDEGTLVTVGLDWRSRYYGHVDWYNEAEGDHPRILYLLSYDAGYESLITTGEDVGDYHGVTFLCQSDWGDQPIAVTFDFNTWKIS